MQFARKVWHLLVAIKDGLVLLLMLLFFAALYSALTARPSEAALKDGALLLKLDGSVVEEPADQDPLALLRGGGSAPKQHRVRDVVRALELAATDDHIKAVVLDLSQFSGGGLVSVEEIGAAMDQVRAAKKPVLTYAVALSLRNGNISESEFSAIQDLVCVGGIAAAQRRDKTLKDYFADLNKNETMYFLDDKQILYKRRSIEPRTDYARLVTGQRAETPPAGTDATLHSRALLLP